VTDSWEYWPYGEVRSGSSGTPFQFVGTLGYYKDTSRRTYVRARHYRQTQGKWMIIDPLWPIESPYQYVTSAPVTHIDPTGQWAVTFRGCTDLWESVIMAMIRNVIGPSIDIFASCIQGVCAPESAPDCLRAHRDTTEKASMTIICDSNCGDPNECGHGNRQGEIRICLPPPKKCGHMRCVIAHELLHACGVLGIRNNRSGFLCVGTSIPGCAGFRAGH